MNQKYVMALVDDDAFCIRADGMNVASFIKEYGEQYPQCCDCHSPV